MNWSNDVKSWCLKCENCVAVNGRRAVMRKYNVSETFERIAMDIAELLPERKRGINTHTNKCNQKASTVAVIFVKTGYVASGFHRNFTPIRAGILNLRYQ